MQHLHFLLRALAALLTLIITPSIAGTTCTTTTRTSTSYMTVTTTLSSSPGSRGSEVVVVDTATRTEEIILSPTVIYVTESWSTHGPPLHPTFHTTTTTTITPSSSSSYSLSSSRFSTATSVSTSISSSSSISASISTSTSSTSTPTAGSLVQAVLNSTNFFRHEHQAVPVTWNATLASYAQSYVDKCIWAHSGGPYGENLALGYPTPTLGIDAWAAEESKYDYADPKFSESTGHFSQLVWKATRAVGCGWQDCSNHGAGNGAVGEYLVCEYWPPGNVAGEFGVNVGKGGEGPGGVPGLSEGATTRWRGFGGWGWGFVFAVGIGFAGELGEWW